MKKLFLLVAMLFAFFTANAQVLKFQTTEFAYRQKNDAGKWMEWTDWDESSLLVVINFEKNRVSIYSNTPQEYDIFDYDEGVEENDGSKTYTLKCIDKDGDRSNLRIRFTDGVVQLYVDYDDFMFVYNMVMK